MMNPDRYNNINFCLKCGAKLLLKMDREEKLRPHCENCDWIYYKNSVPAVACVVINELDHLLLIKRKFEPQANKWALPSGYIEIWQSPEEAAIDELYEETGLVGEIKHFIGYYDGYSPLYEKVLSLGFKMNITGGNLLAGDDALEAVYYPLNQLPPVAFQAHRDFIQKCGIKLYTETISIREKNGN